jgi:hypothetical protein
LKIQIINPVTYHGWDEVLLTNNQSTFFHTSAWAKVLHESYNYKPLYFTLIETSKLKILLPVMEIKSFLTGSRGVSLPFTDFCQPIAENEKAFNETFKEVINYGRNANWKTINLRCCDSNLRTMTFPFETFLTHNLDLSKDEREVFSTFRNSTKRNIKKAVKKGVQVYIKNTLASVKEYYKLHCITRKSHGLPPQPFYFFKKIYEHIISQGKGCVALAKYQEKFVAGAVFFHFENQAIYKYGASDPKYLNIRPNNLVMWEAIQWYCQNGVKTFNFGRTERQHKGLQQFKRGWGTTEEIVNYYKYLLITDSFVKNSSMIKSSNSFFHNIPIPLLKFIGNQLYRHMG